MRKTEKSYIITALVIGFLIWFLATLAFRFAGQYFFITESPTLLTVLYVAVIPLLILLTLLTCKQLKAKGLEHVVIGVLMVLPGMLIDTFVIQFFADCFPNMPASRATTFGSWLMWAYGTVLLTSLTFALRHNKEDNK